MNTSWFRNLFSHPAAPRKEATQTQADGGDAEAQFRLGLKFASREGAAQDYAQAAVGYLKAADQSHALAQLNLGVMYARGQGVAKDDARADLWIRKAAQQGDPGAQYHLGCGIIAPPWVRCRTWRLNQSWKLTMAAPCGGARLPGFRKCV